MKPRFLSAAFLAGLLAAGAPLVLSADNQTFWITTAVDHAGADYAVGNGTNNALIISNGGQLTNVGQGDVGTAGGGDGNSALVAGSNSLWQLNGALNIGAFSKNNTLVISNGGRVQDTISRVGYVLGSISNRVIVTGVGSVWTNSGILYVGYQSSVHNELQILNGGTVYSSEGWIGAYGGLGTETTNNTVIISGAGSLWRSASDFNIGLAGSGNNSGNRLVISNSGMLVVGGGLYASYDASATGNSVWLADGGLLEANTITVRSGNAITNAGGVFQFSTAAPNLNDVTAGTMVMTNGVLSFRGIANATPILGVGLKKIVFQGDTGFQLNSATNAAGLEDYTFDSVANTGTATNFQRLILAGSGSLWRSDNLTIGAGGALSGNGIIQANTVTNRGALAPGHSAGLLTFTSNLTLLASSVVNMELGGTNAALYDRMVVGGALALDGALNVTLINGFTPQEDITNSFNLLDWTSVSGTFLTLNLPSGYNWDTSQLYTTGTLLLIPVPEPGAATLLGIAGVSALWLRFRRRS